MEIESRLLPCGLHVVGCMPTAAEAVATLVNIGEINRPDNNPPIKVRARGGGKGGGGQRTQQSVAPLRPALPHSSPTAPWTLPL